MRPRRLPAWLPAPSATTVVAALAAAVALLALLGGRAAAAPSAPAADGARGAAVSIFLLQGERVVAVRRSVAAPALLRGALLQLLAGPTAAERRAGLVSAVPAGTTLRGVALGRDGTATVDLARRFESGGGSLSMRARLAQLVRTATAVPGVRAVLLRLDGRTATVFSGEGLILSQPLTRAAYGSLG